jgi:hypothetical protein
MDIVENNTIITNDMTTFLKTISNLKINIFIQKNKFLPKILTLQVSKNPCNKKNYQGYIANYKFIVSTFSVF